MAPQLPRPRVPDNLTPANDLWALAGCLLYLATGRGPVDIGTVASMRAAHDAGVPLQRAKAEYPGLRSILVLARRLLPKTAIRPRGR